MQKVTVAEGGCWEWSGSKGSNGYGQFWDGVRLIPAHRFLVGHDSIPGGLHACHKCDNKICVNPSHIFIGTRSDNMRDCVSKGRLRPENGCAAMLRCRKLQLGDKNHEAVLNEDQAILAKACPKTRGASSRLARHFGVSLSLICALRSGRRWNHLREITDMDRQRAIALDRTLSEEPLL